MDTLIKQNRQKHAEKIVTRLRESTRDLPQPAVTQIINEYGKKPFLVLVSCLLSLRTKDIISLPVSRKLFRFARMPQEILDLSPERLQNIIYPTGFYKNKARTLRQVSEVLIRDFGGSVPDSERSLLSLPGVGRKTANLVLGEVFGIPAICVDTHVHRICNRLGLVNSKTPEQTEQLLQKILPKKYWIEINRLLVMWGQSVCAPISPFCSRCALLDLCPQIGVNKKR